MTGVLTYDAAAGRLQVSAERLADAEAMLVAASDDLTAVINQLAAIGHTGSVQTTAAALQEIEALYAVVAQLRGEGEQLRLKILALQDGNPAASAAPSDRPAALTGAAPSKQDALLRDLRRVEVAVRWASERAKDLQQRLPAASRGRVTMGAGVGIDENGVARKVVGTSEPNGYLRPGVALEPDEELARGMGHAEANIGRHMSDNRITPTTIGAGRPICHNCAETLAAAAAQPATELKTRPDRTRTASPKGPNR